MYNKRIDSMESCMHNPSEGDNKTQPRLYMNKRMINIKIPYI